MPFICVFNSIRRDMRIINKNPRDSSHARRQRGVTVIELMIGIVVLAVIISLAVPSFTAIINNNRVTAATNELVASMQLARGEATKRNRAVKVLSKGADWDNGHIVGVDLNDDDDFVDTDEVVLKNVDPPHQTVTITSGMSSVIFNPDGGVDSVGTINVDASEACQRTISISLTGMTTLTTEARPCS